MWKIPCIVVLVIFIFKSYIHGQRCRNFMDKREYAIEYKLAMGATYTGMLILSILVSTML